jgi:hypothetical protein
MADPALSLARAIVAGGNINENLERWAAETCAQADKSAHASKRSS